ncbi:MAG: AI-2E family transporter [Lachnospiraceae bacterium]|nr:AI-2E family transporter [Lachnospiraceae bacterium]
MKEKYSNHLRWAVTTVCTVSICLIIFFLMFRSNELMAFFKKLSNTLMPVIIGSVIAYLINPLVNFLDRIFTKLLLRFKVKIQKTQAIALWLSVFLSMAVFLFLVYFLISLILPELYANVINFVSNFDDYVTIITKWFSELEILQDNPSLYANLSATLDKMLDSVENWLSTSLLTSLSGIVSGLTFRIIGFFNVVLDVVVGLIVTIYILFSKRKYTAKAKRFAYVLFKPQTANTVLTIASRCNRIFGGFISGKLLDSLIIGMMCFIGLSIFKMPYALLVSVIVGITNIIPFFGPFIGAIPSAVLILLADPTNLKPVIIFAIFIICLQQFDGNILGPKILGDSTGISALMVVASISVGGGFFGFMGMLLGVPVFAVISYLFQCFIHYRLRKKGLPPEHVNYIDLTSIDTSAGELHYCTPAASSLSGKPEEYVKTYIAEAPENASFSQTVQEQKAENPTKAGNQGKKTVQNKKKKKKEKKQNENSTNSDSKQDS